MSAFAEVPVNRNDWCSWPSKTKCRAVLYRMKQKRLYHMRSMQNASSWNLFCANNTAWSTILQWMLFIFLHERVQKSGYRKTGVKKNVTEYFIYLLSRKSAKKCLNLKLWSEKGTKNGCHGTLNSYFFSQKRKWSTHSLFVTHEEFSRDTITSQNNLKENTTVSTPPSILLQNVHVHNVQSTHRTRWASYKTIIRGCIYARVMQAAWCSMTNVSCF